MSRELDIRYLDKGKRDGLLRSAVLTTYQIDDGVEGVEPLL